jgi:DNA-binding HxlR family transcriptional regulator
MPKPSRHGLSEPKAATTCGDGACPMDDLLKLLMGPWTTYIIWTLQNEGVLRFGQLKARMPQISSKVLTERLRMLEAAGIVSRDYHGTIPPSVFYALTERGRELQAPLSMLAEIGLRWRQEDATSVMAARAAAE